MADAREFVLTPSCPEAGDPSISRFLELAKGICGADWLELDLRPQGPVSPRRYFIGSRSGRARSLVLDIDDRFTAAIEFGAPAAPEREQAEAISRLLDLTLRYARIKAENEMLRGAFDSTSSAVLLFANDGSIVHANPPADDLLSLQTEDNLIIDTGQYAGQPLFQALCALVEEVVAGDGRGKRTTTLRVTGGRDMICEVVRLTTRAAEDDPRVVMVILRTARGEHEVRVDAFSAAHGLSPREQEVVQHLLLGLKTSEIAEEMGISPHTVRDHLKHLYRKTATGSRGELLGLLSREQPPAVEDAERP